MDSIEQASEVIKTLVEKSDRVGAVLDVIKGLAEQTNLLALNATIEAATMTSSKSDEIVNLAEQLELGVNEFKTD